MIAHAAPSASARRFPVPDLHGLLVAAAFVTGLLLRVVNLGGPAFNFDELFHVFTARSWLAGEGLYLPTGQPYANAWLVTLLTAGVFTLVGESEATARLPAVAFGVMTLALVYVAGRVLFGRTAGLFALALAAVSPDGIDVDRFARFYSPLTLFTLLTALAAFLAMEGTRGDGPRVTKDRLAWTALAALAGLVAFHLHPVGLGVAVVILAYAAAMAAGLRLLRRRDDGTAAGRAPLAASPAARYAVIALGLLFFAALGLASPDPEMRGRILDVATRPLLWYRPLPGGAAFYHAYLTGQYAWLWYLVWPATVLLVIARPRAGLFVALAFWLPFVVMSGVVPTKAPRYISHLLPFAWLLLGGAAEVLWPPARRALLGRLEPVVPARAPRWAVVAIVVVVAAAPVLRLSPSVMAGVRAPFRTTGKFATGKFPDWRGLAREIVPRLPPGAHLVVTRPLSFRYYFGRPTHYLMEPCRDLEEWEAGEDRVRRAADLTALRADGTPVWVLVEPWRWKEYIDAGLKEVITNECRLVAMPAGADRSFLVFACDAPREPTRVAAAGRPVTRDRAAADAGVDRQRPRATDEAPCPSPAQLR
jgi:hypothetical protein